MTKFIVEPASHPKPADRPALKAALQSLTSLVEEFSKAHDGKVKILAGAWINTTLAIDTDQDTADLLARQPGIGKVEKPRILKRD
jgi:hypothetical protein